MNPLIWKCPVCGMQNPCKTAKLAEMAKQMHMERKHGQ